MNVFELAAVLTLDKSQYEDGLTDAEKDAGTFGDKFKSGLGTAAKVGVGAVTALGTAAVAGGKMFIDNAGQVAEYGDNIDKMSQKMGISAEAYQEWDAIMRHSGTTIDALKPSMKTLANQAQSGAEEFQKLGISEKEVAELSQEDLFARVISGLQGMEEGTERTAITSKLLGRGATELGALLNTSAEDTEEMRKKVHELGGVMSDDAVKSAARYQDSLQDMQTSMMGLKNNLMSSFLPAFADVMDGLGAIFSGDSSGMAAIDQGIDTIVTKLSDSLPKVMEVGGKIVESLGKAIIDNLPKLAEAASGIILNLVQSLIAGLPQILETGIQIIGGLVNGLTDALPDLIPAVVDAILTVVDTIINNLDKILEAAGKIIIALGEGLIKALPKLVAKLPEIIKAILTGLGKILTSILSLGGDIIKNLWTGIKDGIGKLGKVLGDVGKAILDALAGIPKAVFDLGAMVIQGFVDGVGSLVDNAVKGVTGFFGGIVDGVANFLGIHSPSKLFAQFGQYSAEGFGIGFDKEFADVKSDIEDSLNFNSPDLNMGTLSYDIASSTIPISQQQNNTTESLLSELLYRLENLGNQQIVLDTGVLVGQTVSKMDAALGNLSVKNARSVIA